MRHLIDLWVRRSVIRRLGILPDRVTIPSLFRILLEILENKVMAVLPLILVVPIAIGAFALFDNGLDRQFRIAESLDDN